jgi:hypothetical protein
MSEWVDFGLYALQAVLLWIVLPAWGARFLQPLDAGNAAAGTRAQSRGTAGWIPALRAWGALSVLALLAYRLDLVPPPLSAAALHRSGPEALLMTSNLMLALGLLLAGFGVMGFARWLKESSSASEARESGVFALTRDDLLPRRLQRLALALVLVALLARPAAGLIAPGRVHDIWGNFFTGLVLAALLFAAAGGSVMRAPNRLDRTLGLRWRQTEVGACYLLMGNLALLEISGLALELSGLQSRRALALLVAGFVCLTLVGLMLLSKREPAASAATVQDDA